jgi:predicted DNA-binding antitoxin AbrB/MazE fold protein
MSLTVEAVYENGCLKLSQPVPLKEHEKVRVTITLQSEPTWVERTAGIMGFTGTAEEADYFALSPDLDPLEDS